MGLQLKPELNRRIVAEKLIYNKFKSFTECAVECDKLAQELGIDTSFNRLSIQQYIGCTSNLSMKRLKVLAKVLDTEGIRELDEVYTFPKTRGIGDWIIGSDGNRIRDIDMTMLGSN